MIFVLSVVASLPESKTDRFWCAFVCLAFWNRYGFFPFLSWHLGRDICGPHRMSVFSVLLTASDDKPGQEKGPWPPVELPHVPSRLIRPPEARIGPRGHMQLVFRATTRISRTFRCSFVVNCVILRKGDVFFVSCLRFAHPRWWGGGGSCSSFVFSRGRDARTHTYTRTHTYIEGQTHAHTHIQVHTHR